MQTAANETYFNLAPLGFPGWEHTEALTNSRGAKSIFIRRVGCVLPNILDLGTGSFALNHLVRFIADQDRYSATEAH